MASTIRSEYSGDSSALSPLVPTVKLDSSTEIGVLSDPHNDWLLPIVESFICSALHRRISSTTTSSTKSKPS